MRVVVAGGGVGGLELILALRDLAGDRVDITLLEPQMDFVYRPLSVRAPFGGGDAERHSLDRIARSTSSCATTCSTASTPPTAEP